MDQNPGMGAQEGIDPWYLLKTISSKILPQFLCAVLLRAHYNYNVHSLQVLSGSSSYHFQSRPGAQHPQPSAVVL